MISERRISAHDTRHLCGGISDMSLWRWLNDPELNFPKPIYIARRRYWKEADILARRAENDGVLAESLLDALAILESSVDLDALSVASPTYDQP